MLQAFCLSASAYRHTGIQAYSQVTEGEKKLRTHSTDTIMGWKTGGVLAVNLAQTSLTNQ